MSVLETCKRAGRSGLEFVSQTLRLRQSPAPAPYSPYPPLIKSIQSLTPGPHAGNL